VDIGLKPTIVMAALYIVYSITAFKAKKLSWLHDRRNCQYVQVAA